MLGLWALLLGANLVRLAGAIDAQAPWFGPALGAAVSAIGILLIGERLGIFRDYPVSKGCTSPFAPIRIAERARRKG